jgi:hypothetical protein
VASKNTSVIAELRRFERRGLERSEIFGARSSVTPWKTSNWPTAYPADGIATGEKAQLRL